MAKVQVELNRVGIREILKSEGVRTMLEERGRAVAERCGEGYEYDVYSGRNRLNVQVTATTWKAKNSNKKHNTLLKALQND